MSPWNTSRVITTRNLLSDRLRNLKGKSHAQKTFLHIAAAVVGMSGLMWAQAADSSAIKPIPGTGSLKPAPGTKFTFIVAGDNRPDSATDPQPPTPALIFKAAKTAGAAFLVWTGDTIYGLDSAKPDAIGKQYQEFFQLAADAGVPVFNAPGNHEMDIKVKPDKKHNKNRKEIGSAAMQKLYRQNMAIAEGDPIYGAFSYANARFILLNSEEIPPGGVKRSPMAVVDSTDGGGKVNLDPGYISKEQMGWLSAELDANKATHTFIFMHHPIKPKQADKGLDTDTAKHLQQIFSKYSNISYVFASHEHLYYNAETQDTTPPPNRTAPSKDPPYYLVSGGAGAHQAAGDFHNYLVVSVDGNNINVKMVKLP
jgi:hypothetical protein